MSPTLEFHDISFRLNVQEREEEGIWLYVFSRILKIYTLRRASFYHFFTRKLSTVNLVEEATPSLDRKMMKLLTFDNLFPNLVPRALFPAFGGGASKAGKSALGTRLLVSVIKLVVEWRRLSRFPAKMTLVHTRASLSTDEENLVLVVVLVLESKGLYHQSVSA